MKNRKRETIFMGIGILAGLTLSGPAAQAATSITATLSSQPIYVDGQRVTVTAYSIGGNNYVRLRDIGKAVDFGVTYDAATNSVYIDLGAHYEQEATTPAETAAVPAASITEESVQAILTQIRETYPSGAVFPTPYRSNSSGPYHLYTADGGHSASVERPPSCSPRVSPCEAVRAHSMGWVASIHLPADKTQCRPLFAPLCGGRKLHQC